MHRCPFSPKRRAYLSALEKLTEAVEEEPRPQRRRVKDPEAGKSHYRASHAAMTVYLGPTGGEG